MLCVCAAAAALSIVVSTTAAYAADTTTTTAAASEDARWPVWLLCVFCLVTVLLSAMYCGLTIGLLGMDMVYIEIIAAAGREPDRSYAASILPVRRLGHRLLVTLLLGNMLTLVITSQLVAAILRASELVNFVVGTLVVLVFGEIVPMSICNNQKYALYVGSLCLPALQLSLAVLYVIAAPLALLLDCLVHHDAGMVYDRQELKKLIRVHCDKYADRSGIDAEQVHMMVSALEMNEVTVGAVMTPMDEVLMLSADERLDAQLQRRLWEYGKSRLPVYEGERNHIVGVLYVKDLLQCVSGALSHEGPRCVRDFVAAHPRSVFVVAPTTLVRDTLLFFESGVSHLMFVVEGDTASQTRRQQQQQQQRQQQQAEDAEVMLHGHGAEDSHGRHSTSSGKHGTTTTTTRDAKKKTTTTQRRGEDTRVAAATAVSTPRPVVVAPEVLRDGRLAAHEVRFLGIVSLEDVIEQLIGAEIYDEDEVQREAPSWDYASAMDDASLPLHVPMQLPRVNFYSYGVPPRHLTRQEHTPAATTPAAAAAAAAVLAMVSMTEEQKWALAGYMAHNCVFLASWSVPQVRYLLDHVQERIVYVDEDKDDDNSSGSREGKTTSGGDGDGDAAHTRAAATTTPARVVLYTAGVPSNTYTLVLSGGVQLSIGALRTELRSFAAMNEEVLLSLQLHTPDYTAVVQRTSRLLQISTDTLLYVVRRVSEARARVGLPPVRLTLLDVAQMHTTAVVTHGAAAAAAATAAAVTTMTSTSDTPLDKSGASTHTSHMCVEDERISSL